MIIKSNIGKTTNLHDGIQFEPIEKQIYDELTRQGVKFTYQVTDSFLFWIDNCYFKFTTKKGKITFYACGINPSGIHQDIKPFEISLKVNEDITIGWNKISNYISDVNSFYSEYKELLSKKVNIDLDIENELSAYFDSDLIKCRFYYYEWHNKVSFTLCPLRYNWDKTKTGTPADGVTCEIDAWGKLFANTDATYYSSSYNMNNLIRNLRFDDTTEGLKKKLEVINYVETKIANFNIENFPLFSEIINWNKKSIELKEKWNIKSR